MSVEEKFRSSGFGEVSEVSTQDTTVPEWNMKAAYQAPNINMTTVKTDSSYQQHRLEEEQRLEQQKADRDMKMKNLKVSRRRNFVLTMGVTLAIGLGVWGNVVMESKRVESVKQNYPTVESLITAYHTPGQGLNASDRALIEQILEVEHGVSVEQAIEMTYPSNNSR